MCKCMNIFIEEKEYVLGVDAYLRARPFYPEGIRRFFKTNVNTKTKQKTFLVAKKMNSRKHHHQKQINGTLYQKTE